MKLLIEGYHYKEEAVKGLEHLMGDLLWKDGTKSQSYVGYYYSTKLNDCVFFLPKVVLDEKGLLFGKYSPSDVIDVEKLLDDKNQGKEDHEFLYGFTVWIYRGLKEFVKLNPESTIVKAKEISSVSSQGEDVANTYLDIMLSLEKFHNENQDYLTFIVKNLHSGLNRVNWNKTISHSVAYISGENAPVYFNPVNKKKVVNYDEELLVIFYSIIDYMCKTYGFDIKVNYNFNLLSEVEFENYLEYYGVVRMKQIRYKYFSDKDLKLWTLCNAFFERMMEIKSDGLYEDYLIVTNYHVVFEAMVDELLSDKGLAQGDLKEQEDGKRVDHIYAYQGLINNDKIYYIGDSKYYNIGAELQDYSVYKQYTYARNVIQHNLSLFLEDEKDERGKRTHIGDTYLIYRDEDTDGYSITPNFFISARVNGDALKRDYYNDELTAKRNVDQIKHFENRLFDRDTLLLQHYDINFLFVLSLYAQGNDELKFEFKEKTKKKFRDNILEFLGQSYQFFSLQLKPKTEVGILDDKESLDDKGSLDAMHRAIEKHFRRSIGKVFRPYSDEKFMYVAIEPKEAYYEENLHLLADLSSDFTIRYYTLNTNPTDEINRFYQIEAELSGIDTGEPKILNGEFLNLEDFRNEVFLIGGWRKDKDQIEWIRKNMLYNVRKNTLNISRDGQQKIDERQASAHYLLLYEIGDESYSYELYHIDDFRVLTENHMKKLSYNAPSGQYIVYRLENMTKNFKSINLRGIINKIYHEKVVDHAKMNKSYGWDDFKGTPIYVTGEEILSYLRDS